VVEPRIELEFENLGMRLHKQAKVVLQGVSGESKIAFITLYIIYPASRLASPRSVHWMAGYFPSGKLSAVMGPSGSGKTTFLNGEKHNIDVDTLDPIYIKDRCESLSMH